MASLRIVLCPLGSRGDFQPFLAIALAARAAGHVVRFFSADDHCAIARSFGFEGTVISTSVEDFVRAPDCLRSMETGDWGTVAPLINKNISLKEDKRDFQKRLGDDLEAFNPTMIIYNSLIIEFIYKAMATRMPLVPRINLELQPQVLASETYVSVLFHRELPDPDTPNVLTFLWGCGMSKEGVEVYQEAFAAGKSKEDICNLFHSDMPPELLYEMAFEPDLWVTPRFLGYSPAFYPNPADWPKSDNIKVLGWLRIAKEFQEEEAKKGNKYFSAGAGSDDFKKCEEFVAQHGAPVYIGWGSMRVYTTEHMTVLAVEAVKRAGVKAIILSGWAQMSTDGLAGAENEQELRDYCKDNVLFIKVAPLDALLPQCKLAVHHGGIGTLQAVVNAGCPSVITPCFADQFDNARHAADMGVGVQTTRLGLLKPDELGDAIKKVVDNKGMATKAQEIAAGMSKEDGVGTFIKWLETFYKEEMQTQRWNKSYQAHLDRLYALREKHKKLSLEGLQTKYMSILMSRYPLLKEWNKKNMIFATTATDLATKGKLWWAQGTSLARTGEGLKTDEAGRFHRFAWLEEVERKGARLHVKRLRGKGPDSGWVTPNVKGKDVVAKVSDPAEISRISQQQIRELWSDVSEASEAAS